MAKVSLTFSQNQTTGKYECVYTGGSGALQIHRAEAGRLTAYGNAGLGTYDLLASMDTVNKRLLVWLDMTGLESVKLVSETAVSNACVNEE